VMTNRYDVVISDYFMPRVAGERLVSAQGDASVVVECLCSLIRSRRARLAVVEEGSHLFRANCAHYQRIAKGLRDAGIRDGVAARNDPEDRRVRPLALQREGRLTSAEDRPVVS
jgi:hypothetical protein